MAKRPASTGSKQAATQFKKGQSGNPAGRPKGSRNQLTEDFISSLAADFDKHGKNAIETVRKKSPAVYVRIVADLVPKDVKLEHSGSEAFMALWQRMAG